MEIISFEAAKSGLDTSKSEDSFQVRPIDKNTMMIVMSDGASTGVFSRAWARHITSNFDTAYMKSEKDFMYGLEVIRESFKPDITRPTALRKFLMEGSYATLYSLLISETGFLWSKKLNLKSFCIGDVTLFVFSPEGEMVHSFPYRMENSFNNSPDLVRSSTKHQEKSPFTLHADDFDMDTDHLLVLVTDALGDFIHRNRAEGKSFEIIQQILACSGQAEFTDLVEHYRTVMNMKNDDVAICVATYK